MVSLIINFYNQDKVTLHSYVTSCTLGRFESNQIHLPDASTVISVIGVTVSFVPRFNAGKHAKEVIVLTFDHSICLLF